MPTRGDPEYAETEQRITAWITGAALALPEEVRAHCRDVGVLGLSSRRVDDALPTIEFWIELRNGEVVELGRAAIAALFSSRATEN